MCAKFYAVFFQKWVMLRFCAFFGDTYGFKFCKYTTKEMIYIEYATNFNLKLDKKIQKRYSLSQSSAITSILTLDFDIA